MQTSVSKSGFLCQRFFQKEIYIFLLWVILPIILWLFEFLKGRHNNYKIFKHVFWNTLQEQNLYVPYAQHYHDVNHYGPFFSVLMAPFAMLPDIAGGLLWSVCMAMALYMGVHSLRLNREYKILLLLLCTIEILNSIGSNQFNPSIAGFMLLTFAFVERRLDFVAPLWVLIGFYVKLYSVVGLLFFFFSHNKLRFIAGSIFWSIALFILPMMLSSPSFILQSYVDWFESLVSKNASNIGSTSQDISLMGFFRRSLGLTISNYWFYAISIPLVLAPLLRFSQYRFKNFRITMLSSLLMFIVLFSTGSEHSTYIICITGIFLWLIIQPEVFTKRNLVIIFLLLFVTGLAPTDAFFVPVREFVNKHALKAFPCAIVWFLVMSDLLFKDFSQEAVEERLMAPVATTEVV